ncbi:MAG: hypothetical protein KJO79_08945 [Verrucomicrobiae bacterium]|nr:hypothetical protein [Verrucomicrobiae bacterium]NNJ87295.1 hypothetical protein [Akkermansiaceae bacterium]
MKNTIITTASMSLAAFSLACLPVTAADSPATPAKPAADSVVADTTTIYIVQVSGKG